MVKTKGRREKGRARERQREGVYKNRSGGWARVTEIKDGYRGEGESRGQERLGVSPRLGYHGGNDRLSLGKPPCIPAEVLGHIQARLQHPGFVPWSVVGPQ